MARRLCDSVGGSSGSSALRPSGSGRLRQTPRMWICVGTRDQTTNHQAKPGFQWWMYFPKAAADGSGLCSIDPTPEHNAPP